MIRGFTGVSRGFTGGRISKTPGRICLSNSGLQGLRGFPGFYLPIYACARARTRTHTRTCVRGGKETPQNPGTSLITLYDNRLAYGGYKMQCPVQTPQLRGFMPGGEPSTPLPGLAAPLPHAGGSRALITPDLEVDHGQAHLESLVRLLRRQGILGGVLSMLRGCPGPRDAPRAVPARPAVTAPSAAANYSLPLLDMSASGRGRGCSLPASAA